MTDKKRIVALFMDPSHKPQLIELAEEPGQGALKSLQAAVQGFIEMVRDPHLPGIDIFFNEQGRLKGMKATLILAGGAVIVGPVVLVGNKEGEAESLTKEQQHAGLVFLHGRAVSRTLEEAGLPTVRVIE